MTTIVSSHVRHRRFFAPHPNNTSFPTRPEFTATRLIRDIKDYPPGVRYANFDDVIETRVRLPDGTEKVVYSAPLNEETFLVQWDEEQHRAILANHWPGAVEVHPDLKGKVWVVATEAPQLEKQRAA